MVIRCNQFLLKSLIQRDLRKNIELEQMHMQNTI